ncbi:MAG: hypothetical protein LC792_14810 [Actinobacteria bacterium]|nr:hypothetical protein [Actinomycetota bacterium]
MVAVTRAGVRATSWATQPVEAAAVALRAPLAPALAWSASAASELTPPKRALV